MTLVLANGCFDLLHVGHIRHLQEARELGTHLVVAVTMDEYVGKGPGRPVETLDERMEKLRALHIVSAVTPCRDAVQALQHWTPDIFVKGQDYAAKGILRAELGYCEQHGIRVEYTKAEKFSTAEIIERIKQCE